MKISEFKYFYPERPRLLSIEQDLFERFSRDPNWVAEKKYNGSRLLLWYLPGKGWQMWNRHEKEFAYMYEPRGVCDDYSLFEELDNFSQSLSHDIYLFDGEFRHNKVIGVKHQIVVWDALIWAGNLQIGKPYQSRRSKILNILPGDDKEPISVTVQYSCDFQGWFDSYRDDDEIEGLVLKHVNGMLKLGRNSAYESNWMYKVRKKSGRYQF